METLIKSLQSFWNLFSDHRLLVEIELKKWGLNQFPWYKKNTQNKDINDFNFGLILHFILVFQVRELTLTSIPHVVLLQLCKKIYGFVNLKKIKPKKR